MGRHKKITDKDWSKIERLLKLGVKKQEIAKRINVHPITITREIKRRKKDC
jgi:IS30 family transposase